MIKKSEPQPSESGETFDALRQRIRDRFPTLSPHLQRIARASLEETNAFALNTTPVIAAELGIQPSTLIRFAKELGYSGFSDLQRVFRQRLIEGQVTVRDEVLARDEAAAPPDTRATFEACLKAHTEAIERLARECDTEALNRAIQIMRQAGHIYVAGLRRSRPIADYFHYGMIRGEKACSTLDFSGGMAGPQIATMRSGDVLFAIAFPPYSQPVVDVVLDAHVSGRRIVAMTDSTESPLATYAEVALLLGADTATRLQPISGAVALVQTLVMAITRH
ncbi:MurR/RpiR family transcriptional regulator [Hoeflea sp. EC-HK425]|jgi:DNA-binding MurR/RpiR family transcriptional regulator|uniref:MurR/RpiR family transcriptional regulator n=1 Tax=Hoeflea sp. EC-HK425 TaxID=2038388 RepID=UPI001258D967|nr:MurR/RpiR family transcriptional regulator [Hoeflea sp. EC-HK425]VVT27896.1 MurPQ operon repressor [Hoeflea sp. EC-HK425]|tara:strand:- start:1209 stop:2042 length:834 start_codon:yes stop_codon:yes gene_type:complete